MGGSYKEGAEFADNEVFDILVIKFMDVPVEKQNKTHNLLIFLKRKHDQRQEITRCKARQVIDGSRAQIGVFVFYTYAPSIIQQFGY